MGAIEWKDATSYSQGERGKIEPTAWECTVLGARIWISCGHLHYPGEWIINCSAIGFDQKRIGALADVSAEAAQAKALQMAGAKARSLAKTLTDFANLVEPHQ